MSSCLKMIPINTYKRPIDIVLRKKPLTGNAQQSTYNCQSLVLNERHINNLGAVVTLWLSEMFFLDQNFSKTSTCFAGSCSMPTTYKKKKKVRSKALNDKSRIDDLSLV